MSYWEDMLLRLLAKALAEIAVLRRQINAQRQVIKALEGKVGKLEEKEVSQ